MSNTPALPPCYELRTHLRPILHMVLRHLLIASQLQLLDSPPSPHSDTAAADTAGGGGGSGGGSVEGFPAEKAASATVAGAGEESATEQWPRDWHGTSSDAFEIAVAVLKVGKARLITADNDVWCSWYHSFLLCVLCSVFCVRFILFCFVLLIFFLCLCLCWFLSCHLVSFYFV